MGGGEERRGGERRGWGGVGGGEMTGVGDERRDLRKHRKAGRATGVLVSRVILPDLTPRRRFCNSLIVRIYSLI